VPLWSLLKIDESRHLAPGIAIMAQLAQSPAGAHLDPPETRRCVAKKGKQSANLAASLKVG
jgi:hypothetical protein